MTKLETINWEQRRYELAKDIFIAFLTTRSGTAPLAPYIGLAIEAADALIEDLKK